MTTNGITKIEMETMYAIKNMYCALDDINKNLCRIADALEGKCEKSAGKADWTDNLTEEVRARLLSGMILKSDIPALAKARWAFCSDRKAGEILYTYSDACDDIIRILRYDYGIMLGAKPDDKEVQG